MVHYYCVGYQLVDPLCDIVALGAGDLCLDTLDIEKQVLGLLVDPISFFTEQLNDMISWGLQVVYEQIAKLLNLGIPLKTMQLIEVRLFEQYNLAVLIME